MSARASLGLVLAGLLVSGPALSTEAPLPPEAEAVRKFILEKDYPELFQGTHYRVRISNLVISDVDNDGHNDVTVHFDPHYRQSATIAFYRVGELLEVARVLEGLAPGPLQPISGDYLDSHTLGLGVDLALNDTKETAGASASLLRSALKQFGGVVAYANFFHVDSRDGNGTYIDLTQIPDSPDARTCEKFEFSKVRDIAVGHLKSHDQNYLSAWVGDEIYVYQIRAFQDDGLLDKRLWVRKAPPAFQGFMPGKGLAYLTASGTEETLDLEKEPQ